MKEDIEPIRLQVEQWDYLQTAPKSLQGFDFALIMAPRLDMFEIFSYENASRHLKITTYYHFETREYKLRQQTGLHEFCNSDYITEDLGSFARVLNERMPRLMHSLMVFEMEAVDCLLRDKGLFEWAYIPSLPQTLQGFELFIRPDAPLKVPNGSYVIIDYSDFATESNFIIYYNIFRDQFFAEIRMRRVAEMDYSFDCSELSELADKLAELMEKVMTNMRQRLNAGEERETQ